MLSMWWMEIFRRSSSPWGDQVRVLPKFFERMDALQVSTHSPARYNGNI